MLAFFEEKEHTENLPKYHERWTRYTKTSVNANSE